MDDDRQSIVSGQVTQDAVFRALGPLLRELCSEQMPGLAPDTVLANIPGIDSLRIVQAVALMEEMFEVEINMPVLDRIETVADILRAIADAADARQRQPDA